MADESSITPIDPIGESGVTVKIGGTQLSLREFQDLYAELNKKNDTIFVRRKYPFILTYEDLRSLHQQLNHAISHYKILASAVSINVSHLDNESHEFNNFDEFMTYNKNMNRCVESIHYEIKFSLESPIFKDKRIREYALSLRLFSSIAVLKEHSEEMGEHFEAESLFFITPVSSILAIRYVDYAIAASLSGIAESWLKSLKRTKSHAYFDLMHKYRKIIMGLTYISTVFAFAATGSFVAHYWFVSENNSYLLLPFVAAFAFGGSRVGHNLVARMSEALSMLKAHSRIELNAADRELDEWYDGRRKKSIVVQAASIGGSLLSSLIVGLLIKAILSK